MMRDHDRPPTVAMVTLGCGRNEVDSENVAGMLSASGFRMVADPEQADAVIVNTCAFIQAAKEESIETVLAAADLKEGGRAKAVLVTGCMAERYTRELREELPEADAVVPFGDYGRLPEVLRSRLGNGAASTRAGVLTRTVPAAPVVPASVPATGLVPPGRRTLPLVFPTPPGEPFPVRPAPRAPVALVKLAEAATGTARSAPSPRSGAASARAGRPECWPRWRGWRAGRLRGRPGRGELDQLWQRPRWPRGAGPAAARPRGRRRPAPRAAQLPPAG